MGAAAVAQARPRARVQSRVARCDQCPATKVAKEIIGSFGATNAPITLVVPHHSPACAKTNTLYLNGYAKFLWSLGHEVGLHREDCRILPLTLCRPQNPRKPQLPSSISACGTRFRSELAQVTSRVILCLGGESFRAITGLTGDIHRTRGYWYRREDCRPAQTREWVEKGTYGRSSPCKACKGKGYVTGVVPLEDCPECKSSGWRIRKGDPKYGWASREVPVSVPETVEWIFATYEPDFVMADQMRSVVPIKVDLDRVMRALRGETPEEVQWKRR